MQSIYFKFNMLPPICSRPSIRRTAGSFLNDRKYWIKMLNGHKTIETRLFEKTELGGPASYTHVIFRMVKRIRKACMKDHVMAKLGGRMGPFNSAREAVEAAAQAGRKLGLTEDELLRFMKRKRKIRSGPLKGMKQEVIIPVVLYLLDDIHIRDDIYWFECEHDQAGFLRYKHTPKRAVHSRRHFGYFNDEQTFAAPPHAVSTTAAVLPSSRPIRAGLLRRRRSRCRPPPLRTMRLLRARMPRAELLSTGQAAADGVAGWDAASSAARIHAAPVRKSRFRARRAASPALCNN